MTLCFVMVLPIPVLIMIYLLEVKLSLRSDIYVHDIRTLLYEDDTGMGYEYITATPLYVIIVRTWKQAWA